MKRQHEIEDDIAGIRAWEDTIVRILTDGHAKRMELEKELKELKMAADDIRHPGGRLCSDQGRSARGLIRCRV